jgi:cell division protein FtsQ
MAHSRNEFGAETDLMLGLTPRKNRRVQGASRWRLPAFEWRRAAQLVLGVLLLVGSVWGVKRALDQPIEKVEMLGRFQRVQPVDVEQAVRSRSRGVGLLSVNLATLQRSIETLPWVDVATVERAWPNGLRVTVIEQVATARWGANGLLNARGDLFMSETRHIPAELPKLSGPNGTERQVGQRYLAIQGRLVEAGARITALRLDARGSWEIDLDSGVTVRLGRRQIDERFERFVLAALKLVAQRGAEIDYVDMRYTNGFAVGWRGGTTRLAGAAHAADDNPEA